VLDAYLKPDIPIRQIEHSLFSVFEPDDEGARYDSIAVIYDRFISSPLYLRLAWGGSRSKQIAFIREAFNSQKEGCLLDLAAGSCIDSVYAYAETDRPIIVVDRSLHMLRRGMERMVSEAGAIPENVWFLQADALSLPIIDQKISTVLCHGAFHLFPSTDVIMGEWRRVLCDTGTTFVSSLVLARWVGDRYLNLLYRSGEVSKPMTSSDLQRTLSTGMTTECEVTTAGNFAYARM
jgi:ubiquinone/menaquinone biosynthesis C-methylase UbiE